VCDFDKQISAYLTHNNINEVSEVVKKLNVGAMNINERLYSF
jgi:hypothetical protein